MSQINYQTHLPIVETFHSVQTEGSWMGTNAFFIRLAGCDVISTGRHFLQSSLNIPMKVFRNKK